MSIRADKLLILDLDETLIYATSTPLAMPEDFRFDRYFVYKRPFLERFLTEIAQHYKLGIWSSATEEYVQTIVGQITPPGFTYEIIWGRNRCTYKNNLDVDTYTFEKRLSKLKRLGFALEQILVVDDTPAKARVNFGNAIYIKEFRGDPADFELNPLYNYLLTLKTVDNVRLLEKRYWRNYNDYDHLTLRNDGH